MGWKTVIGCGQSNNDTVSISTTGGNNSGNPFTAYAPVGAPIVTSSWEGTAPTITLATGSLTNYSPHTSSGMALTVHSVSNPLLTAPIVHQLYINGSAGNQNLTIQANTGYSQGQAIHDTSHSDAIPGGASVAMSQGWTGTSSASADQAIFTGIYWQADCPGGACVPWVAAGTSNGNLAYRSLNNTSWEFIGLTSSMVFTGTISNVQTSIPSAGVWSDLQINVVSTNGATAGSANLWSYATSTFNDATTPGAAGVGNQHISISHSTPNNTVLSDTSHTDAIVGGDVEYLNYALNVEGGGSGLNNPLWWSAVGSTWTSSQPNSVPLTSVDSTGHNVGSPGRAQLGYTVYRPGFNQPSGSLGTEGPAPYPTAGVLSGLNTVTQTANTAEPFQSLINNSVGNQSGSLGGSAGVAYDSSHTDAAPANTPVAIYYPSGFNTSTIVSSHAANFRTPDGTGAFSMGLG